MSKKKIPDHARLVFQGVVHHIYQWDEELFDGSSAVFEAIKRNDGVTIVATVGDRIIINNEDQPHYRNFRSFPGGITDLDTSLLENAKRELLEETGYVSDDWEPWFTTDILKHEKIEWNNHYFIARNCKKVAEQKLDPGERIQTTLVTFDELLEFRNDPKARTKDLFPVLEEATNNKEKRESLKKFLFGKR